MSGISIVAGTGGIIHQNIDLNIRMALHSDAGTAADLLIPLVEALTPVLTGALISDYTHDDTIDPMVDEITEVYASGNDQTAQWNRIYVQYVEGGALGEATWTNAPREMFQITADTTGLAAIEVWATAKVQEALDLSAIGAGLTLGQI